MECLLELQALENKSSKELLYAENKVRNLPQYELKFFFADDYSSIKEKIQSMDKIEVLSEYSQLRQSLVAGKIDQMMERYMYSYVLATLRMRSIEELYSDELNRIYESDRN